jgi:hypothetical protein
LLVVLVSCGGIGGQWGGDFKKKKKNFVLLTNCRIFRRISLGFPIYLGDVWPEKSPKNVEEKNSGK